MKLLWVIKTPASQWKSANYNFKFSLFSAPFSCFLPLPTECCCCYFFPLPSFTQSGRDSYENAYYCTPCRTIHGKPKLLNFKKMQTSTPVPPPPTKVNLESRPQPLALAFGDSSKELCSVGLKGQRLFWKWKGSSLGSPWETLLLSIRQWVPIGTQGGGWHQHSKIHNQQWSQR